MTPAIGELLIPRFAFRHPWTVESLVHYMHPDGSPRIGEFPNALLQPGTAAMGTMVSAGCRGLPPDGCQWGSTKWVGYQS